MVNLISVNTMSLAGVGAESISAPVFFGGYGQGGYGIRPYGFPLRHALTWVAGKNRLRIFGRTDGQ